MRNPLDFIALALILLPLQAIAAPSQSPGSDTCRGPIYMAKEVTRRARIIEQANLNILGNVRTRVVVDAVLCRSGRVTDIKVIEISPGNITEFVIGAISEMRFKPAELKWHTVSQRQRFEFQFGPIEPGVEVSSADAAARIVESVDIMGHRRLTTQEILSRIKTRPGERYNSEQVKKDFDAVLATGYFDKLYTRVFTEDGVRGGLAVIFEVVELPLIAEVKFEGLNQSTQSEIVEALRKQNIDLRPGAVFDVVKGKMAVNVIKQFLLSKWRREVSVDFRIYSASSTTVSLTFLITNP
jgi:surface antigen-like variable number repeat protein